MQQPLNKLNNELITPFINHNKLVKYDLGYKASLSLRDKERISMYQDLEDRYIFQHIWRGEKIILKMIRFTRLRLPKTGHLLASLVKKKIPCLTFVKTFYDEERHAVNISLECAEENFDLDIKNKSRLEYSDLAIKVSMLFELYREVLIKNLNDGDDVDARRAQGNKIFNPLSVFRL